MTPDRGSKGGAAQAPPQSPPPSAPVSAPPPPYRSEPPRRGPGATAGLVLIVIGVIFLAAQLVPGVAWWTMWPLIVVVAGGVQAVTPGKEGWGVNRLFDGLSTVAFGLVLLAVTTGFVGIDVFWKIATLWPVLLIAIGLELLGKAMRLSWIRALGSIVVILALAYAVGVSAGRVDELSAPRTPEGQTAEISESVGRVTEAQLKVEAGVANVTIDGGRELVRATGTSPWGAPVFSVDRSGNGAEVTLSTGPTSGSWVWPGTADARLDAEISERVLWDIVIEAGVSSLDADLSGVRVESLALKPGVADAKVRLGPVPSGVDRATARVDAGVSAVTIEIPEGTEARIESDSGLTGHSIDDAFVSQGSRVWESEGFDEARDKGTGVWIVTIKSGVGSINVRTY